MLTTSLHPKLKLRMNGAKPLLPLYVFMARTVKTARFFTCIPNQWPSYGDKVAGGGWRKGYHTVASSTNTGRTSTPKYTLTM